MRTTVADLIAEMARIIAPRPETHAQARDQWMRYSAIETRAARAMARAGLAAVRVGTNIYVRYGDSDSLTVLQSEDIPDASTVTITREEECPS